MEKLLRFLHRVFKALVFLAFIVFLSPSALLADGDTYLFPRYYPFPAPNTLKSSAFFFETLTSIPSPYPPEIEEPPNYENPSLHGRRMEAYQRTVSFIREERYSDALAYIRRAALPIRDWRGLMTLEAALISQNESSEALKLYDKIFDAKERDVHFVRALMGYKFLLSTLIETGDHNARFRLIKCLAFEWRNREARELLLSTLEEPNLPDSLREELLSFGAILAMRQGDFEVALDYFKDKTDLSSLRWLSTVYVRLGLFSQAATTRAQAASFLKGKSRLNEYAKVFDILTKGGLTEDAVKLLQEVPELKGRVPAWSFYLGLSALVAGDPDAALEYLEPEITQTGERGQRALYFKGRALEEKLQYEKALEAYQSAVLGPFNYYRLLSEGSLRRLNMERGNIALATGFMELLVTPTGRDENSMGYFLWLSQGLPWPWPDESQPFRPQGTQGELGRSRGAFFHYLYEAGSPLRALEELINAQGLIPKKAAPLKEEYARFTLLAARCGEYKLATRLMNSYSTGTAKPVNSRWNHPLVYAREISLAYRRYNLPPQLTLSVIRTESAFQKDAVSLSNARGLMQLLPSTAESVAQLLGEAKPGEEDLFEVDTNIRYGSYYLYLLVDAFDSVPMALAAYNGGPFNMVSLISARDDISMDLFVETLPFSETSNYVRRVLESVYNYEMAYLGKASYPDLSVKVKPPRKDPPPF